jgi:hypothetical protein
MMFMDLRIVYHNPSLSLWVQPEGVWAFPLRQIDNQMEKQWASGGRFGKLMQSALALILGSEYRGAQCSLSIPRPPQNWISLLTGWRINHARSVVGGRASAPVSS